MAFIQLELLYRQAAGLIAPQLSPMALSFWQENRRVSNQLLTEGLGYRLLYPSYREGLRACLSVEEQLPGWGNQG
jgi:hypothetical protein